MPLSLRSEACSVYPGMPFGFPPEPYAIHADTISRVHDQFAPREPSLALNVNEVASQQGRLGERVSDFAKAEPKRGAGGRRAFKWNAERLLSKS